MDVGHAAAGAAAWIGTGMVVCGALASLPVTATIGAGVALGAAGYLAYEKYTGSR